MDIAEHVMRVRTLSDEDLQASLGAVVGTGRKLTALILAHLGEVEERRLHLLSGYDSMFDYCTRRLAMSEDEACRRVEVARLARRFPLLFERLASGAVSLSVAALLKHHLSEANQVALLAAVSGQTVGRAREVLAEWFPRPDAPAAIRKLPERASRTNAAQAFPQLGNPLLEQRAVDALAAPGVTIAARAEATPMDRSSNVPAATSAPRAQAEALTPLPPPAPPPRAARASSTLEPLSPGRFKVTFTADADLKLKLDLARDLLRHAVPRGDLASIIGRAIDVLIEKTERRRFARTSRPETTGGTQTGRQRRVQPTASPEGPARKRHGVPPPTKPPTAETPEKPKPTATGPAADETATRGGPIHPGETATRSGPLYPIEAPEHAPPAPSQGRPRHLPNDVRRAVIERDGPRCTWQGPDGTRCNSRAWLELDHIVPRGQGGTDDPANIRPYCRAHNQLAAEQSYGQHTIARIKARRRARKRSSTVAPQPPPQQQR